MSTNPGELAKKAALLECSVQKPGNVGPDTDFDDTTYDDFIASARILGEIADRMASRELSIGGGILDYVDRSLSSIGVNAHLGTAILIMPLAKAAGEKEHCSLDTLHKALEHVLDSTDNTDAVLVYRAIRKMHPGGLRDPHFANDDVELVVQEIEQGGLSYLDWMALGAGNDGVAKEIRDGYPRVFHTAKMFLDKGISKENILLQYLKLLAEEPDTFVIGKRGKETAIIIMEMAREVLENAGTDAFATTLLELDTYCRQKKANPGTTADLIGAAIYAALLAEERG